jgi:hypothetical protein
MRKLLAKLNSWFRVPRFRFIKRTVCIKVKSRIETKTIPITVNGKQKEIVLQKEHAFEVAKKLGVFRPLVCMKSPFDPFWEWYRKICG